MVACVGGPACKNDRQLWPPFVCGSCNVGSVHPRHGKVDDHCGGFAPLNLTSLPFSSLQQLQQSIARAQALLQQAQGIAYDVQNIDQAFRTTYGSATASMSSRQLVSGAQARWQQSVQSLQDAMRVQATVVGNLDTNRSQM